MAVIATLPNIFSWRAVLSQSLGSKKLGGVSLRVVSGWAGAALVWKHWFGDRFAR